MATDQEHGSRNFRQPARAMGNNMSLPEAEEGNDAGSDLMAADGHITAAQALEEYPALSQPATTKSLALTPKP